MTVGLGVKIAVAVVALFAAFGAGWLGHAAQQPDCPTEDSCSIDYRNGAWHIEPDSN